MNKPLTFRSGGSSSFKQTADSLLTNDTVEVLLGLSEGPIKGPLNGPKSFYADGTQIVNDNGEPNFSSFNMMFWPGSDSDQVSMALGGFASPVQINTTLVKNVTVTRQGLQTHITAADFRILIEQLYRQDSKGVYTDNLQLKFEYKATSGSAWLPCFASPPTTTPSFLSPNGVNTDWSVDAANRLVASFFGDVPVLTAATSPPATPTNPALAVTPTGNVYSWDTSSLGWFQIETTPGAGDDVIFQDTVGNEVVNRHLFRNQSGTPVADDYGDVWDTGSGILMWNGSAWVTPGAFDQNQYQPDPQYLDNGVWSWNGKVSSNTPINIRVYVPDISDTYQFRVTKLSTDTTTQNFSVVSWESIEEIKQSSWTFNDLAMLKVLGRASDQFTSLPQWETDAEGRIIRVPTNYDPVARTYTGVWDGTYKLAYTNNPAWIFLDFVENTRYGLSSIYPHVCNKWSIYAWAQYCDTPVPTAAGGTQPRWTYNDWITQPRDAKEMAQYIAGAAGALYIDDGNGFVEVMVDQDATAVALFTPENITQDGFSYSYTDRLTRANETTVSFANPQLNGATDKRIITNDADIAAFGTITDDFIAAGCYDVDEALRRARRRQVSGLTEKEFVTFTTNRKGKFLSLWEVILVADADMGRGLTGRIKTVVDTHNVTLRDPITLEAGFSYQVVFDIPDITQAAAFTTVTLDVTTSAGVVTALSFSEALPTNLPEYAAFTVQCTGDVGLPKPYRVLSLDDDSSSGELVTVTALELNRNKYAYIDAAQDLGTVDYSNFYFSNIDAPTNMRVSVNTRTVGDKSDRILTLSWDSPSSPWVDSFNVSYKIDGTYSGTINTKDLSVDVPGANRGQYTFELQALGANGKSSPIIVLVYDTVGQVTSIDAPRKVKMSNGDINYDTSPTDDTAVLAQPDPVVFSHPDAAFSWRPPANLHPNHTGYKVRIYVGGSVIRTEKVGDVLEWTYDFAKNKSDGLHRAFTFSVCAVDQDGTESVEVMLSVNNPPPALATATIELNPYVLNLTFTPPTDLDYGGVVVSLTTTPGQTSIVYQDKGNPSLQIAPGTTYYVKYAFYDEFGTTGLNWSNEVGVDSPLINFNEIDQVGTHVNDLITAVTGPINTELTVLESDVSTALTEAGLASVNTSTYALNLANLKAYVDALVYISGQPVGPFAQATQAQTATLQSITNLLGVKSDDGLSFILNGSTVQVSNGVSLTSQFNTINSQIGTVQGSVTSEAFTRSTADSALSGRIDTVQAQAGNASAAVTTEATTRATEDLAIANVITGVSATYKGATTVVNQTATALATATGQLYGTYGLGVNAGGSIANMVLFASSGAVNTSGVIFEANYFQIKSSSNPSITPFTYDATSGTLFLQNITVRGANIQTLSVDTIHIKGGAVSNGTSSNNPTGYSISAGATQQVNSASMTTTGGLIQISGALFIAPQAWSGSSGGGQFTGASATIKVDGTSLTTFAIATATNVSGTNWYMNGGIVPIIFAHTPSAGSHTWTVEVSISSSVGVSTVSVNYDFLNVLELKK